MILFKSAFAEKVLSIHSGHSKTSCVEFPIAYKMFNKEDEIPKQNYLYCVSIIVFIHSLYSCDHLVNHEERNGSILSEFFQINCCPDVRKYMTYSFNSVFFIIFTRDCRDRDELKSVSFIALITDSSLVVFIYIKKGNRKIQSYSYMPN